MKNRTKYTFKGASLSNVKIGDVHYDHTHGITQVLTTPRQINGDWFWKSVDKDTNRIVDYFITENSPQSGSDELWDYEMYCSTWNEPGY